MSSQILLTRINCWHVRVPALEEWTASPEFGEHLLDDERVLICLEDADGFCGWGESALRCSVSMLEETLQRLCGQDLQTLRPAFLDLWPPEGIYWHRPIPPSPYAPNIANIPHRTRHPMQTLVEMALDDLIARRAGIPLAQLWGGLWRDRVRVDYWMGRVTPEHARRCVARAKRIGFRGTKLKTTLEDPNVERLEAIRDAGGSEWKVTVDPNGRFYRLDDALPTIREMERVGNMAILEDPFPRFHLPEFAALRQKIDARVVVHIDPPESLWSVLQSGAAGGLNIDSHTQGLFNWRLQAGAAAQANLPVWHGTGLDLGIYTAAQLHAAAATPNCTLPGDQIGPWLYESHLLENDFEVIDGTVLLPAGPGTGVNVSVQAVEKYAVGHQLWKI